MNDFTFISEYLQTPTNRKAAPMLLQLLLQRKRSRAKLYPSVQCAHKSPKKVERMKGHLTKSANLYSV